MPTCLHRFCFAYLLYAFAFQQSDAATIELQKLNDKLDLITIIGPIQYRDDVTFRLKTLEGRRALVALTSPGGNLDAGLSIGKQIRENGYSTLVGSKLCASACALAWLGGVRRYMAPNASVGFHAAYISDGQYTREVGMANALVGSYLARLGLEENAIRFITAAPPDYMNWLDFDSARHLGIDVLLLENGKIVPNWASPKLDESNSRRAAVNFFKRLKKSGMMGLVESVEACYRLLHRKRDVKSIEYCTALDWCAHSFDRSFSEMMKGPRIPFFEEELVIRRYASAAKAVDWGGLDPEKFFHDTTALAERLLGDKEVQSLAED